MKQQSGEDKDIKEGGKALPYINWRMKWMAAAVVRGQKKWKKEYAIIFIRLFYFRFYVVSLTRGPSKWGEGTNVVAPVRRGFFIFIFNFFYLFIVVWLGSLLYHSPGASDD